MFGNGNNNTAINTLGRFKITEGAPQVLPHKCSVCGYGGPDRRYVDFGLDLDFYGTVYICVDSCLLEVLNQLSYHSPSQWKMALATIEDLRAENNQLKDTNEVLNADVNTLKRLLGRTTTDTGSGASVSEDEGQPDKSDSKSTASASGADPEGEAGTTKQNDEQGSPDLQHDDSLDTYLGI